jgi:hypothetical protein
LFDGIPLDFVTVNFQFVTQGNTVKKSDQQPPSVHRELIQIGCENLIWKIDAMSLANIDDLTG